MMTNLEQDLTGCDKASAIRHLQKHCDLDDVDCAFNGLADLLCTDHLSEISVPDIGAQFSASDIGALIRVLNAARVTLGSR